MSNFSRRDLPVEIRLSAYSWDDKNYEEFQICIGDTVIGVGDTIENAIKNSRAAEDVETGNRA